MTEPDRLSPSAQQAFGFPAGTERFAQDLQPPMDSKPRRPLGRKQTTPSVAESGVVETSQQYAHTFGTAFNPPLEHWFAQFAVRVGGYFAWLTSCPSGKSVLFRYTSHLVILGVLIGAIALVGTAQTTQASDFANQGVNTRVVDTANTLVSSASEENYNLIGQGGPILVDQIVVAPQANPYTLIPSRERRGVITYTVQAGDTLFGIAGQFGLRPESVLWANYDALQDNPHLLNPGMELAIPPVNGIVYTVETGDTVESIAEKYKVTSDAVYTAGFEWNQLKPGDQPVVGVSLIIPGGSRDFKPWSLTAQVNSPGANSSGVPMARNSNAGFCSNVQPGLPGTGTFIWPAPQHWVSGNNYTAWHPGIDIAAHSGDPIYASDNGVVVYSGSNNWGYGNLVVIDHGNGWQTWYAHNSEIYVACGQNVYQGSVIAAAGSTGHSTGPHLHFETRYQGTLPNPFNVLPPP